MALVTNTVYKTQAAAVATALTTIYQDTSASNKVASEIADPKHPLRDVVKLLNYDPKTGTWTSNDALIDAVYAGANNNKGTRTIQSFGEPVAEGLATATVENAAPTDIVLTYNVNVKEIISSFAATVNAAAATITNVAIAGTKITLTLSAAVTAGQTVVVTMGGVEHTDLSQTQLTNQAVTNNVT